MKKKLFTLFSLLGVVCMVNAQKTVSIGTGYDGSQTINGIYAWYADWAEGTTVATTPFKIDADTEFEFTLKADNKTDKQTICGTSKVEHLAIGSNANYLTGTAAHAAITALKINGSTNKKVADNKPNSIDVTFAGIDGKEIENSKVTVLFPTSDAAWQTNMIVTVPEGAYSFTIKRTTPDSGIRISYLEYTLTPSGPSDNATLSSIKIGEEEATLNETTYSYELPASYEGETASVVITPASDKAIVTVSTDETPNTTPGVHTATVAIGTPVTVSVKAEAGNTAEYILSLTKATNKSSDTSLSSLTVDGAAATPVDGETGKYTFDIPYAYDGALEIIATPTDNLSTVSEITTPVVAAGASVDVKFTVTAEDKSTQEYTLTITRAAASTECVLKSFSINGFTGTIDESAKTVEVKVVKDYDFSHTPVMNVSALATAAWDKATMKVKVTAEDGVATAEYTVSSAAENILPYAASAYPYELSFAAATYTEPVEWIYGAPYNANQKDPTNAEVVGCYELASESTEGNIAKGTHALNVYLAKCGTLTLKVGATGGRNLVATVNGNQCGSLTIDSNNKNKYCDLVCTVDSDEPVVITVTATGANGGTRIYSMNVTEPTGLSISSQAVDDMDIYAANGKLYISSSEAKTVNIYGIDGRLVKTVELNEGMNTVDGLIAGIYLVNNQKVVINK